MKRYVAAMIRDAKTEEGLTEENFKVCSSNRATMTTPAARVKIPVDEANRYTNNNHGATFPQTMLSKNNSWK